MSARRSRQRRQAAPELPAYLTKIIAAHASGAILSRPGIVSDIYVSSRARLSEASGRAVHLPA